MAVPAPLHRPHSRPCHQPDSRRKGWVLAMLAAKAAVRGSGPGFAALAASARLTASQGREDGSEEQGLG